MSKVLVSLFVLFFLLSSANAKIFSKEYKVLCPSQPDGCQCYSAKSVSSKGYGPYYHYQPIEGKLEEDQVTDGTKEWVTLLHDGNECFIKRKNLKPIFWHTELCPDENIIKNLPFHDTSKFLAKGSINGKKLSIGKIFPTFYNIANESYYDGPKTVSLLQAGSLKLIAKVTPEFRDDLDMEGTGILNDGRILNVGNYVNGKWRYVILPAGTYGLGIYKHYLYPSRTVAIDFNRICKKTGVSGCTSSTVQNRKNLVGALIYIPKLVGTVMPNGFVHDGYMCAQDIGGAIKDDRVDIFVGPMGGGNPYLQQCHYTNHFIENDVVGLTPFDWRTWDQTGYSSSTGFPTFKRKYKYEYRTASPGKALEIFLIKGAFCKGKW
jgi:3D (Asp-Asp-Asp) domain-containing protein